MKCRLLLNPINDWVWELQERMQLAHTIVITHTGRSMNRQKHYRDNKLSFEAFEVGDSVYVFFPVHKIGPSA